MDKMFYTPAEIGAIWVTNGVNKSKLSILKMILLGIFAGIFIGFGAWGFLTVLSTVSDAGMAKLLGASVFPVGLMLVIICGAELFTGNNLMTLAVMDKQITWGKMFRNWIFVYIGNAIGSYLLAYLIGSSGLLTGAVAAKVATVAAAKVALPFWQAVARAILCNMLVVLACWLQAGAKDIVGKIFAIFFPIMLFVLSGYEHSVANMFFIPLGQLAGAQIAGAAVTTGQMWLNNILPVTLGNILGGAIIVPVVYYLSFIKKTEAK